MATAGAAGVDVAAAGDGSAVVRLASSSKDCCLRRILAGYELSVPMGVAAAVDATVADPGVVDATKSVGSAASTEVGVGSAASTEVGVEGSMVIS